jgi:hypothetical protein
VLAVRFRWRFFPQSSIVGGVEGVDGVDVVNGVCPATLPPGVVSTGIVPGKQVVVFVDVSQRTAEVVLESLPPPQAVTARQSAKARPG